jgi:2,3-bisphosphoglycerate-dependent phosphoglycerate mutase
MSLENISQKDILELNIPTGVPLVYYLKDDFSVVHKEYLRISI